MSLIIRPIFLFAANLVALLALNYLVVGFQLVTEPTGLVVVAAIFTALNTIIRPMIRYFLTTFLVITLGLFSLVINAGVLIALDFLSVSITINGLAPLIQATVIMTAANILISFFNWILFQRRNLS